MPTTFGNNTKSIFLNGPESHKLALQFQAANYAKLTLSGNLVTSNKVNMKVNGVAMPEVTFATDHATTMAAIATALEGIASVKKAIVSSADNKILYIIPEAAGTPSVTDAAVTAGAGQATFTIATSGATIYPGMPVGLIGIDELVAPLDVVNTMFSNTSGYRNIGVSIQTAEPGELLTAYVRGYVVTYGIADGAVTPGPVKYTGYDTTDEYCKYAVTSQVYDSVGWALDNAASGEVFRVLQGW